MATNVTLKRKTASGTDDLHPTTDWSQINSKPGTFAPTAHTHGNINDDGQISATAAIASGDHLVIADNSSNDDLTASSITFGTSTTQFLANNGTWRTVSGTDSSKLPLTGGTLTGDLTMQKDGSTNVGSHGVVFQANTSLGSVGDFTKELNIDTAGNLQFDGNTIFHAGNDGSASGLHADLLDGQQGSYYLNYNNFTNTPTIPTDTNNYLTGVSGSGDGTVTFTRSGLSNITWDASHSHSEYLPLAGGTMTGGIVAGGGISGLTLSNGISGTNFNISGVNQLSINDPGEGIQFLSGSSGTMTLAIVDDANDNILRFSGTNAQLQVGTNRVLTTADEGSGNGLDADTLDGSHASAFAAASHNHSATDITSGTLNNARLSDLFKAGSEIPNGANLNSYRTTGYYSQNSNADASAGSNYPESLAGMLEVITDDTGNGLHTLQRYAIYNNANTYVRYYYNGTWSSWRKEWNSLNDGASSGLDADLLDGQHGSYYAPKASPALTGTPTAPTAAANTNTTQIATTAYVQTEISDLINGANASFDTLKEIQDAMATDTELSNAINNLTIGNGSQTITAGTGLSGGGVFYANQVGNTAVTISHADTSSQASLTALTGANVISDIDVDGYGHITSMSTRALTAANIGAASTSHTHSNYVATAGDTMTGDLVLDHDGTGTAADSHALRFTARAANTDFSREIKLEDGGGFAFDSNILLTGDVTTNNAARTIDFTGFDKEGTTDFSDRAYIQHTTNTGGHSGSVLVISSQNDSNDGIAFQTNASSRLKHNSNSIFTDAYHPNADKLTTARNIALTGAVTGNANFDGSSNISIATTATADPTLTINGDASGSATFTNLGNATLTLTVADDSHNHIISNVDGLQTALDGKASSSHTHSNYVAVSGDTMTGDLTLDHDGTGSAADSHGVVFTARFNSTDFTRELYMDDEANLLFGTNTIFHSGNDGSSSGLHADLLDGQQGSYYLDYNNFSNTPTIPTNNNQLTNGAGYVTGSHSHSTSNITSGEFNTARLGSGTATSGYVLKSDGDGTASWQQDNNTTYSLGSFGVTATAAELNKMDGVTATTTELNYTDGVTSNIQTQLNGKLSTSAAAAAVTYVTSCPTSNNSTGMKVYVGSTDCSTKYTGWLYIVT